MKLIHKLSIIISLFIVFGSTQINNLEVWFEPTEMNEEAFEALESSIDKRDRMDLAWQQEFELTKDPALGIVPRERLYDAWKYMQQLLPVGLGKAAIPNVNWVERGPNNCGGRSRTMWVDFADPTRKTVWVGSVGGGLWKTNDITQNAPNWQPVNNLLQNLAVTSITQARNNTAIMYFGTGEGNGNLDAVRGLGIWKSTNNGGTWTQLSSTNNSNFYYCQKIMCSVTGDTVLVCTRSGLYRSINGGSSFTKVLGTNISSSGGDIAQDIEIMSNGTIYATMSSTSANSGTIHKSFNWGATFTTPLTLPSNIGKEEMEIGVSTVDTNTLYLLVENANRITGILKSTNAGQSFDTTIAHPVDADTGIPGSGAPWKDFSRSQGWYDLSIVVDPNNPNVCFVGGIDLFKTANGGASWSQVSHWYGGFGFQEVHADQQFAFYEPGNSNVVYFTNDGGIYRCSNATAAMPTIVSKEINYNTTQFYAGDIHPNAGTNLYLAGAQDNGSHRFNAAGINATAEVTGGDGAFCHIDQNEPQFMWTSYVYTSYYRSTNGGNSFSSVLSTSQNIGSFISPTDYDDIGNRMYMCGNNGFFVRWNNPQTGNSLTYDTVALFNNGRVTHVKVSPNLNTRVFFGLNNGRVIRIDSAHLTVTIDSFLNNGKGMPSGSISCIEVENGNDNHLLVTYSNYGVNSIWETKNGGVTWSSVEGNMPDMPIRWALFNPLKPWQAMVATELGVWSTDSLMGSSTNWQPSNNGFANVRTDMLKMRNSDYQIMAATHGRGVYTSNVFSPPAADFVANKTLTYIGEAINFTSISSGATSYLWNFGDATTSTTQNPVKVYNAPGIYNISLTINGNINKTVNAYITILPYKATPYLLANGGNFDTNPNDFAALTINGTAFQRGNSTTSGKNGTASGSFAWVTGLSGSYANNTEAHLYSPSFNFTASGTYNLTFKAKNKFEIGWDGYLLEYSTNHGVTWQQLGNSVQTNWYDFANNTQNTAFNLGIPYFNATRSSYTQMQYNVSFLAGNNKVCFRWVFKSDGAVTDAGVALDDFEITGPSNTALPVNLTEFYAQRISPSQVNLYWKTASEKNNKGFWVERKSSDDFERLHFENGKINATQINNYQFTDNENSFTISYYRLAQVDLDGKTNYSKIIAVDKSWLNTIKIYSQPGFKTAVIDGYPAEVKISVYQLNGNLVQPEVLKDNNQLKLIFNRQGIYIIVAETLEGKVTQKIFVD